MALEKLQIKTFKSFRAMTEQSESWKQGALDFKNGVIDRFNEKLTLHWLKRSFSLGEWNNFYKHNSSYCFLGTEDKRIVAGFCTATDNINIPDGCTPLSDEEILQVDEYRKSYNVHPRPLRDMDNTPRPRVVESNPEKEIDVEELWEQDVF